MRVADTAENDAAERPGQEPEAIGEERREQRRDLIAGRKEFPCEDHRDVAVDRKVVPLEHVADDGGGYRLPRLCLIAHCRTPTPQSKESPLAAFPKAVRYASVR